MLRWALLVALLWCTGEAVELKPLLNVKDFKFTARAEARLAVGVFSSKEDDLFQTFKKLAGTFPNQYTFWYTVNQTSHSLLQQYNMNGSLPQFIVFRKFDEDGLPTVNSVPVVHNGKKNYQRLKHFYFSEGLPPTMALNSPDLVQELAAFVMKSGLPHLMAFHFPVQAKNVSTLLRGVWKELKGEVALFNVELEPGDPDTQDLLKQIGISEGQALSRPRFGLTPANAAPDSDDVLTFPVHIEPTVPELINTVPALGTHRVKPNRTAQAPVFFYCTTMFQRDATSYLPTMLRRCNLIPPTMLRTMRPVVVLAICADHPIGLYICLQRFLKDTSGYMQQAELTDPDKKKKPWLVGSKKKGKSSGPKSSAKKQPKQTVTATAAHDEL